MTKSTAQHRQPNQHNNQKYIGTIKKINLNKKEKNPTKRNGEAQMKIFSLISVSQHGRQKNNLSPYYGLNNIFIVHFHKYQLVKNLTYVTPYLGAI